MATLTSFRAGGVCGNCRSYGRMWVTNRYGSGGATYAIGDDVAGDVADDLADDSYVIRAPRLGEAVRVLGTWKCQTCRRHSYAELVFADGWLIDLRAVELTTALLDRVHYISQYDAEVIEGLIGRSMWEGPELWADWLPALRAAVARREASPPEVQEVGEFPLGGTLDGGRYTIVEHYLGGGADQLWFARSAVDPAARYLVSTTSDNGFDPATDAPDLLRASGGRVTARFVGTFDGAGAGGAAGQERRTTLGFVQQVPHGWPLPLTRADTATHAFRLGAQVAERVLASSPGGRGALVGLRPEYVWVAMRESTPEVTGAGGQNRAFFAAAMRRRDLRTVPLFTRRYIAPEVHRGDAHDDRALVFTIALMTAEWALGRYPYDEDGAYGYNRLCRGEHVALSGAAAKLAPALSPDPAARPDLAALARTLELLAR